ncbi:ABC transporter permease [Thalassotalea sp. ND16A]|uniref:ABC transporter permease n=1 Tax=Thalassotalea sp. ND16A TaxID=1535422 RepID=UPI00051A2ED8|nr:ABC transporter permease [Thalassotalea sp. ND16A]KGJ97973.1 hypothetical protein ND16A_0778 [Thalassotalea sp. ND16A]
MKALIQELKLALHALCRVTGFSATIITTLSLTLGALICIFNLNHLLLVKELPYPDAEQLVVIKQLTKEQGKEGASAQTIPGMLMWYKNQTATSSMAMLYYAQASISDHPEQPRIQAAYTTNEYFSLLAPPMHLGRGFSDDEGFEQHRAVAVLSYASWQKWFNSDPKIIGQQTQIGDSSFTIIGVSAEGFHEPRLHRSEDMAIFLPWDFQANDVTDWGMRYGSVLAFAKLKTGVTMKQASANLSKSLNTLFLDQDNVKPGESMSAQLTSFKDTIIGDSQNITLTLLAGVIGLLLIAATNVTNLFLSRAAQKQRTMAIQAALGAKPGHLFTAMFAESLILCGISALIGLVIAGWGFVLLGELAAGHLPRLNELSLDAVTLLFSALIAVSLAALFAKLSSRVVNYEKLKEQLQCSGKGSGLQVSSSTRNILVCSQVALASLLLMGGAVVIEQAVSTVLKPLGFNEQQLMHLRIDEGESYTSNKQRNILTQEIKDKLSTLPQVAQVSRSMSAPIDGSISIRLNDVNQQPVGGYQVNLIDDNYFDTLQLPIIRGRTFTKETSLEQDVLEIILSESLARKLAPTGDALGKIFQLNAREPLKVVGIAKDYYVPNANQENPAERYYLPFTSFIHLGFDIKLKTNGELSKQQVINLLKQIHPNIRIAKFESLVEVHHQKIYRNKLAAGLAIALTLLALLLAAAGIYGVLNYSTQMRRYELGIHLALGAKTHTVMARVLKESFIPIALGLLSGIVLAALAYLASRQYIAQQIEFNQLVFLVTFPVILLTAFISCYLPVRKIILADPVKALRSE